MAKLVVVDVDNINITFIEDSFSLYIIIFPVTIYVITLYKYLISSAIYLDK